MLRTLSAALSLCGVLLLMPAAIASAMASADTPIGTWLRADGRTVFDIESCPAGLCGRISGFVIDNPADPAPLDWRGQNLCGEQIISVAPEYGVRNSWHGSIVNPRDGNVWQATLTLVNGSLQLRGYFGVPLFGETENWTPFTGQIGTGCRIISLK